jgi:hypothetical protein
MFLAGLPSHFPLTHSPDTNCDLAVDGERLAMIARDPAERTVEARPIERVHLRAGFREKRPQHSRPTRSQPVVDDPDVDARAGLRRQGFRELPADGIVVDDVVLEQDRALGVTDGAEPSRIVFGGVLQEADGIAIDGQRARSASECAVGQRRIGHELDRGDRSQAELPPSPSAGRVPLRDEMPFTICPSLGKFETPILGQGQP